jgi:hypothetical protein
MSPDTTNKITKRGDLVVVSGHHVGDPERTGEILEVLGDPGHERYKVRWDDGHESIFHPGSDALVRHKARTRKEKK